MSQPRILTFNFHEPYLSLMAKTGLEFDVGYYDSGPLSRPWQAFHRPIPPNMRLIGEHEWRMRLDADGYGVVIAHNEMNAITLPRCGARKLLVCHNRRTFLNSTARADGLDPVVEFDRLLDRLREQFEFIYISESKRGDYGIPGRVILPGIDIAEWGGYTGEIAAVLRVGNTMAERDLMFDMAFQEEVLKDFLHRTAGLNPGIPDSAPAESFEDLRDLYRTHRCLLHVTRQEYEDGYNLAMLEAMACGMPVVSLANRTSPITNGADGFVSYDASTLRHHVQALLEDRELAAEIGVRGRETVARNFPVDVFIARWREAILGTSSASADAPPELTSTPRLNILLHGIASPMTTARYFEEAARESHNVLTAGFRLPEAVFQLWGFDTPPPAYRRQQIDIGLDDDYATLMAALPQGYAPDVYLWIDCGHEKVAPDIDRIQAPKIAYLIDTHVKPEMLTAAGRNFDCCFLAQKGQVALFHGAGILNAYWLPLACAPALHQLPPLERIHDVAYVGALSSEENERRRTLLESVGKRFPNSVIGKFWPKEMARIYAQSKIVVNACANRDINMRVFEAMASGALLITDEADGLEELFEDGVHLVIYRNDADVFGLVERYLADRESRERIARAGQERVLESHTYAHRIAAILDKAREVLGPAFKLPAQGKPKAPEYYGQPRSELIPHIPFKTRRLLDVGCGAGVFAEGVRKERNLEEVVGLEIMPEAHKRATQVLDQALLGSIEEMDLPFEDGHFDTIVCADVLEHLVDPAAALRKLARVLAADGVIVISIPNIRYHQIIEMLSEGFWTYMDLGIMDATHLRFFTRAELETLIAEAGLEAAELMPLNARPPEQLPLNEDGSLTLGKITFHKVSEADHEALRTYQYVIVACKPGKDRLDSAREALARKDFEAAFSLALDAVGVDEFERNCLLARSLTKLGQLEKAERFYRAALSRKKDAAVLGDHGILLLAMNEREKARERIEEAVALEPSLGRARGALGMLLADEGNFEAAFSHLQTALGVTHDNYQLIPYFVNAAEQLGRLEETIPVLRTFTEFYPGNLDLSCEYARILAATGYNNEARKVLETVLMLAPSTQRAQEMLAALDPN